MKARDLFTTIRTEGGLLPADLLQRIVHGDKELPGLDDASYHLVAGERLNERISQSWNRLLGTWKAFRAAANALPETDTGTTLTRERWLLVLLQELGYGRLPAARASEVDGKSYPLSHFWHRSPMHLVSYRFDLGARTAGIPGVARTSPHSLVQEFLNRSDDHLWGFVSNGLRLRLLRDNVSLTRQAYVEFDLEGMMEGEVYADFVVLWLLCHQSRVEAEKPEECWLERWARTAQEQGTRALDRLRDGVEQAIKALGRGFLAHSANAQLKEKLRSGALAKQDYYRQLLRLIYRLLFLFVAEDRDLLYDPKAAPEARERYTHYYSTARLRRLAASHRGTKHVDLYRGLRLVMEKLGSDEGCLPLALPALGSFLWSETAIPDLAHCDISNRDFLEAIRALAFTLDNKVLRSVDYKNLGSEELGSIYESLLELHPELNVDAATFNLTTAGCHERKTTGSYYTPSSLIQCLLDSALNPVLDAVARKPNAETAILGLKVCDPACGSGHFLVAAAHRIARRLAAIRTGDEEPSPEATRTALRDVISHCIYGVDMNPMAVELCKVSLWMEALEPGKPLTFLDHHIQCGHSLLGTTPTLLAQGIPDEAFTPIEGDDKAVAAALRRRNKVERAGQTTFAAIAESAVSYGSLTERIAGLDTIDDSSITGVHDKEEHYNRLAESAEYRKMRLIADAWCAAFFWKKIKDAPEPVTYDVFCRLLTEPEKVPTATRFEIKLLAEQYNFFHWHLAFPDVFHVPSEDEESENTQAGWSGGFDVVLGNPPWERTSFEDLQFFSIRAPEITEAATTARRKELIKALSCTNPELYNEFVEIRRKADTENLFYASSGRYPLGSSGRTNTYALFTDVTLHLINCQGRSGTIVQTGIATDAPMEAFWRTLVNERRIVSLYDFENRLGIFPGIDRRIKFCLLTLQSPNPSAEQSVQCGFFLYRVEQITDTSSTYILPLNLLQVINPNTKQPPVCRSQKDLNMIISVHKRHPILLMESAKKYRAKAWRALMSAGSSQHYRSLCELLARNGELCMDQIIDVEGTQFLPLIEAKQTHQFDPYFATYSDVSENDKRKRSPRLTKVHERSLMTLPQPRFWAERSVVEEMFLAKGWKKDWSVGIRDVSRATDERTAIACILPRVGLIQPLNGILISDAVNALWVVGAVNSFALDYIARQKTPGIHLNVTIFSQLPVPEPESASINPLFDLVIQIVLELSYVISSLAKFANECGYDGPPFCWNEERRFLLRCELDAAYFHLYGIAPDDVDYIMETFPIVKRNDMKQYGDFRTKLLILDIYDRMQQAMDTGELYQTLLDPPPADPRVAPPPRTEG